MAKVKRRVEDFKAGDRIEIHRLNKCSSYFKVAYEGVNGVVEKVLTVKEMEVRTAGTISEIGLFVVDLEPNKTLKPTTMEASAFKYGQFVISNHDEFSDYQLTFAEARLLCGEAHMMCNECGARLYSFDGDQDKDRSCPTPKECYDE